VKKGDQEEAFLLVASSSFASGFGETSAWMDVDVDVDVDAVARWLPLHLKARHLKSTSDGGKSCT